MSATERKNMRKVFFDVWEKHQKKELLEPLEAHILSIIIKHPEYHEFLTQPKNLEQDHFQEQNPFLHMSLHLALKEQMMTDRPAGIKAIYTKLCLGLRDPHLVEHKMMDCLASMLWDAQTTGKMPDEHDYLAILSTLKNN